MENPNRHKLMMLGAFVVVLWGFMLLPNAEDLPEPQNTSIDWVMFVLMNLAALVMAHVWISAPVRAERRREQYRMRRELRSAKRRHPTAR
jgi:hypothetical protein